MTISLASAWHPRGELARFQRLVPQLGKIYAGIAVSLPPDADVDVIRELESQDVSTTVTRDWSHGRHAALGKALESSADFIHYADFDRLLHWVETSPTEWLDTVARSQTTDCLIVGRTTRAYQTHPRALVDTEAISNAVASYLLGRKVDISAGSKCFSRRAAEYLMEKSAPGHALGMDSQWMLMLHHAGFRVDYVEVDGLDWESADRYSDVAADRQAQQRAADAYDSDPSHWSRRVEIAMEIVECAISESEREEIAAKTQ